MRVGALEGALGVEFEILGPLRAMRDGRPVDLGAPKQQLAFAVLLANARRHVSNDRLVQALWGDRPPASAVENVYLYVSRLRRALGAQRITSRRGGYTFELHPGELDADRFTELMAAARTAFQTGHPQKSARHLHAALALWRGTPFAELSEHAALREEVDRLERQRLDAVEQRIEADLAIGCHDGVVAELQALVARHPYRERFYAQLMLALYRCGRRADALDIYRHARNVLVEGLGLDPGAELRELERAILANEPGLSQPPGQTVTIPAELPAAVPDLTGRTSDLRRLDALREQAGNAGIVLITGTAGVGKTALAAHWAHGVAGDFPDGQLWVNLEGFGAGPPASPLQALARLLRAVGVEPTDIPTDLESAQALYRTQLAAKQMLVVLDNAASVDQVRPLLPGGRGSLVVITSRDRLSGLIAGDGARRYCVEALSSAEAIVLLGRVAGTTRAAAEPEAAAELAALCDHLPLALRIAAANLVDQPGRRIAEYVAELRKERLSALSVDGDEHLAVRWVFDSSFASLRPPAQRLFTLLGLVPGRDFTAAAAAAVAGVSVTDCSRTLDALTRGHLVEQPAPDRFVLHDLLGEYARECADRMHNRDERDHAVGRLLVWYLRRADGARELLYPQLTRLPPTQEAVAFASHAEAHDWLETEHANLVAAVLETGSRSADLARLACQLGDSLRGHFWFCRIMVDWLAVTRACLTTAESIGDLRYQAACRLSAGLAHFCLSDYQSAKRHYSVALTLSERVDWLAGQAAAHGDLANVAIVTGSPDEAAQHYSVALRLHREIGSVTGQAIQLSNLGQVYVELGQPRDAVEQLTQAVSLHRQARARSSEAFTLFALGVAHHVLGQTELAQGQLAEALTLSRQIGCLASETLALSHLAGVSGDRGDLGRAIEIAETGLERSLGTQDPALEATARVALGNLQHRLGAQDKAILHLRAAVESTAEIHSYALQLEAQIGLATVELASDRPDAARRHAASAHEAAKRRLLRRYEGQALSVLAAVHLHLGERAGAAELARQAVAIHVEWEHRIDHGRALAILADAVAGAERAAMLHAALRIFAETGARHDEAAVRDRIARSGGPGGDGWTAAVTT